MNVELRQPPSARDIEVFRHVQLLGNSTWSTAERFQISQTRVRQIISRVRQWLAENLPEQTDEQREGELRLAQHLAAERMQTLYCQTMTDWNQTHDSKSLRHTLRVTAAMARMGIVAGKLDELMAVEDGEGKAESGEPKAEVEAERRKVEAEVALSPPVRDFSPATVSAEAERRRREFFGNGNVARSEGYVVPTPLSKDADEAEIKHWIALLSDSSRSPSAKPIGKRGTGIVSEVRLEPGKEVSIR